MKMRVGDIEMDQSKGIVFHGADSPARQDERRPEGVLLAGVTFLALGRRVYRGVATLALLCALILVGAALSSTWSILLPVPGLLLAATLALALAARSPGANPPHTADTSSVVTTRMARIAAIVESSDAPVTVEALQQRLGWTEEAVVSGLHALVEEGRVLEDLDLDSGHWTYTISSDEPWLLDFDRRALPVADRARAIHAQHHPVNTTKEKP